MSFLLVLLLKLFLAWSLRVLANVWERRGVRRRLWVMLDFLRFILLRLFLLLQP